MKKAFSLLELIFTISIVAIIALVAIPKLSNSLEKTNILKFKSDIAAIREGLSIYKRSFILKGEPLSSLDSLDIDEKLFKKVINYTILSSSKSGSWEKLSNSKYKAWISSRDFVEFSYDKNYFLFDCDLKSSKYCLELLQ